MDIPIANEIDNKLYINNAKLQEIIYYDPESNTYSNVELKKNYYYISIIIITSISFYIFVILYELNKKYILDKTLISLNNSTSLTYLSDNKLFNINYV